MKALSAALVTLAAVLMSGCRQEPSTGNVPAPPPPSVTLGGQLFTLRSDGMNLPLGGVEVSWVPRERLAEEWTRINERTPRIEALLAYESELRELEATLGGLRDDTRAGELLAPLKVEAGWQLRKARAAFEQNEDIELLLETPRFARNHPELFAGSGFENQVQAHWQLVHLFLARIEPLREHSATSDSNGRFKLKLPDSRDGYLLAHAQTTALGEVHHDYWILQAGSGPRNDLVLSSRARLLPREFHELNTELAEITDPAPPDLGSIYRLPELDAVRHALARAPEITANLDQREALERRISALRQELEQWAEPEAP